MLWCCDVLGGAWSPPSMRMPAALMRMPSESNVDCARGTGGDGSFEGGRGKRKIRVFSLTSLLVHLLAPPLRDATGPPPGSSCL